MLQSASVGDPKEYLNPWIYPFTTPTPILDPGQDAQDHEIATHLARLMNEAQAKSQIFALKLQGWQLTKFLQNPVGEALFDQAHVVYLVRSDIRQQVISQAAAKLTGQWYDDRSEAQTITDREIEEAFSYAMRFILAEYAIFTAFFAQSGVVPQVINSHRFFANPSQTVRDIADAMGLEIDAGALHLAAGKARKYRGQDALRERLACHARHVSDRPIIGHTRPNF